MSCLFDFDLELVDRALHHDEAAFELVCKYLLTKYDQIERQVKRKFPDCPPGFVEHVRDSFIHDKFLPIFRDSVEVKIDDFNALCWTILKNCMNDAYRHFTTQMRNFRIEVAGDATEYGEDGTSTFWEVHGAEILRESSPPSLSPEMQVELTDFFAHVRMELGKIEKKKQRVVWMWAKGFTEKEIAAELGLTTGNVGCIVSRVISDLRKKLCKRG